MASSLRRSSRRGGRFDLSSAISPIANTLRRICSLLSGASSRTRLDVTNTRTRRSLRSVYSRTSKRAGGESDGPSLCPLTETFQSVQSACGRAESGWPQFGQRLIVRATSLPHWRQRRGRVRENRFRSDPKCSAPASAERPKIDCLFIVLRPPWASRRCRVRRLRRNSSPVRQPAQEDGISLGGGPSNQVRSPAASAARRRSASRQTGT
jgi:hypothetical protein